MLERAAGGTRVRTAGGVPAQRWTSRARRRRRDRIRRGGGAPARVPAITGGARRTPRRNPRPPARRRCGSLPLGARVVTAALRRLASAPSRVALGAYVPARTLRWRPASRLFAVGDEIGWSIDDDAERLAATARRLGYDVAPGTWAR